MGNLLFIWPDSIFLFWATDSVCVFFFELLVGGWFWFWSFFMWAVLLFYLLIRKTIPCSFVGSVEPDLASSNRYSILSRLALAENVSDLWEVNNKFLQRLRIGSAWGPGVIDTWLRSRCLKATKCSRVSYFFFLGTVQNDRKKAWQPPSWPCIVSRDSGYHTDFFPCKHPCTASKDTARRKRLTIGHIRSEPSDDQRKNNTSMLILFGFVVYASEWNLNIEFTHYRKQSISTCSVKRLPQKYF